MKKLSSFAHWTQYFIIFGVVPAFIFTQLFAWAKLDQKSIFGRLTYWYGQSQAMGDHLFEDATQLPIAGKLVFYALLTISTILLLLALFYLFKLLQQCKTGFCFSQSTIGYLRKIKTVIFVWAVYELFFETIGSLVVSLFKLAGTRYITVKIGSQDVMHFLIALLVVLVLHLVQEAYTIKSEQDLVV